MGRTLGHPVTETIIEAIVADDQDFWAPAHLF
jgi:hypothetical protein